MKLVIPWVCVFGLLVGCFFLYATTKENEKEIAKLHQDDGELTRLRDENAELKKMKVDHDEVVRLRNDHEELLRLRGEVGPLRKQNKQLTAELQAARAQASAAVQQQQQNARAAAENETLRIQNQQLQQKQAQAGAAACIHNLQIIEAAKEIWASDNHKPAGSIVTQAELTAFLPNNTFPVCPNGGTYNINPVGAMPTCTVAGHAIPK